MKQAQSLKSKGRFGDTELVHMSKSEVNTLARLAERFGTHLTKNPKTGLTEAYNLNPFDGNGGDTGGDVVSALATGGASLLLPGVQEGIIDPLTGKAAADAADRAAALSATATDRATAENARQFDIGQANLAPWLDAGKGALTAQQSLMGLNGTTDTLAELQNDPGYQFRLNQGQKSLDAGLAARGGMGSGKSLTAGIDYNQGFASQEYSNRLNQLAGLSGTGQTTGTQMANNGMNFANNQGSLWTNNANMQGAAGIAGANARQSGLFGLGTLGMMALV
jgi:hypothetical protein